MIIAAPQQKMKCFEIVRDVLEEIYDDIPANSEEEKDKLIIETMKSISDAYKVLKRGNDVNHSDIVSRFAYIYVYVTSHANFVYQIINNSNELKEIFENGTVDVSSIGGGPGSELLGILKYLYSSEKSLNLYCKIFDRELAWGECWEDVNKKIPSTVSFNLHTFIRPIDVFNSDTWIGNKKFLNSDLFTMIFFLSEIYWKKEQAEPFFQNLFSNAKSGSLFLYVDNNDEDNEFHGWFDEMAKANGLEEVFSQYKFDRIYDFNEDKEALGRFWDKFGAIISPKLKGNIAVRICRKT